MPAQDLLPGHWYWGGGRGGPVALWDGAQFVMPRIDDKRNISAEKEVFEIEVTSGYYGAFVPYEEIVAVPYPVVLSDLGEKRVP